MSYQRIQEPSFSMTSLPPIDFTYDGQGIRLIDIHKYPNTFPLDDDSNARAMAQVFSSMYAYFRDDEWHIPRVFYVVSSVLSRSRQLLVAHV